MHKPIAIFYHGLFVAQDEILPASLYIIPEQMKCIKQSGLYDECKEFQVGINGGEESKSIADYVLPLKGHRQFHGQQCRNELRTLLMLEQWCASHPGWNVLYLHSKGATHPLGHDLRTRWRNCMMRNLVSNWRTCVAALENGYDSVGCHWLTPPFTPPGQYIWGGNFWWATSDYLRTLPGLMLRDRVKISGLDSIESRFEAEVWIGNGPRAPRVLDLHPGGLWTCP